MTSDRIAKRTKQALLLGLGVASLVPLACGGSKQAANGPSASASFSFGGPTDAGAQPPPPDAAMTAPAPSAAPLGSVYTTDPNQIAQLLAAAASAAAPLLQNPGMGDPVEAGLQKSAARNAPGMQPEGQIAKGNLAEGGHLGFLVNMLPGKCYTVIGYSPSVQNLDLNLLAPPFYTMIAAQDGTHDASPVIGRAPNPMCPVIPFAVPYKVDIYAQKGAGPVGVQVYSKNH